MMDVENGKKNPVLNTLSTPRASFRVHYQGSSVLYAHTTGAGRHNCECWDIYVGGIEPSEKAKERVRNHTAWKQVALSRSMLKYTSFTYYLSTSLSAYLSTRPTYTRDASPVQTCRWRVLPLESWSGLLSLFRWELLIRVFISTTYIVFAYFFVVVWLNISSGAHSKCLRGWNEANFIYRMREKSPICAPNRPWRREMG